MSPKRAVIPLDHDALHQYFWRHRDARGRTTIHVTQLAVLLGTSRQFLDAHVSQMAAQGRLRRVAAKVTNIGVYEVADPASWDACDPATHARARCVTQWG